MVLHYLKRILRQNKTKKKKQKYAVYIDACVSKETGNEKKKE